MQYTWDFGIIIRNYPIMLDGFVSTIYLSATCLVLSLVLGLFVCVARMSQFRVVSYSAMIFIEFLRASPLFVLLMWFYFAFPVISGLNPTAFEAAVIAISLQSSAFFAEIFRSGIQSIFRGQWEAAKAIGMTYVPTMRYVILPQAVRRMIPVFFTRTVELIKSSSLASVISYSELVFKTKEVASITYRPIEAYTVLALVFFCTLFVLSRISIYFENSPMKRGA